MEKSKKDISATQKEIYFSFSWAEFSPFFDKAFFSVSQGIKIDGFRPGKAPKEILESKISVQDILTEAANLVLNEHYQDFLLENNWQVVDSPQVEIIKLAKGNDFQCRIKAQILPPVELPDYSKLFKDIPLSSFNVEQTEIEKRLNDLRKMKARLKDKNSSAEKGDFVKIKYQSQDIENNKVFEDGFILGEGQLAPGFEGNLVGAKEGEKKQFSLQFDDKVPNQQLAGKKVSFDVEIEKVMLVELPALDAQFAETFKLNDLAQLKEKVKEALLTEKKEKAKSERRGKFMEKIRQESKVEIPSVLLDREKFRIKENFLSDLKKRSNLDLENYLKQKGQSEESLDQEIERQAWKALSDFLIIKAIGDQNQIEVSEKEVEQEIQNFLTSYPHINPQEIDKDNIKVVLYNNKVFEKLEAFRKNDQLT